MAKKNEIENNDDYEFRIVSSTLSPLTNEGIKFYNFNILLLLFLFLYYLIMKYINYFYCYYYLP